MSEWWKNPWVIGGGAALGLVILLTRGGGSSSNASADQGPPLGYLAQLNEIGGNVQLGLAEIAGQRAIAQINADTVLKASILDMMNVRAIKSRDIVQADMLAQSGIAQSAIVANSMAIMARQENQVRGALASIYPSAKLAELRSKGGNGSIQTRDAAGYAPKDLKKLSKAAFKFPVKRNKNSYQINPPIGVSA